MALRKKRRILKRNLENLFIGTLEDIKEKISNLESMGIDKMVISFEETGLEDPLALLSKNVM